MTCKILAFSTEDCPACDVAKPIVKKVATQAGIEINYLDPTNEIELAQQFNVCVMPTFVLLDGQGDLIESIEGFIDENTVKSFVSLAEPVSEVAAS